MEKFIYLKLGMLLFLMVLGFSLRAQTIEVTGQVTDESGEPIPGATVLVKGTTTGMATDMDGRYSMSTSADAVLVFSFIGFQPQEVVIGNRSIIDIKLVSDFGSLEEVVVIGYGTVR